jgi:aldehyde dehydrogenase (NAD+)
MCQKVNNFHKNIQILSKWRIMDDSVTINSKFERLKKRSQKLRKEPWRERKARIKAFGEFLLVNEHRIGLAVQQDIGKPLVEVSISEVYPVITEIKHAVENLKEWVKPELIDAPLTYLGTRSKVLYEPKGVCLIIGAWNFPINLCLGPLISCLAAGNTAILKPSELTPNTSRLLNDLIKEFFDDDLVTVVEGGVDVSSQLLALPFDHIFFTGSSAVGKIVMRAAAENLSSVTLELGGKSPTIIDETANLADAAKRIAFGKFLNNGQTCIAPDYILIKNSSQAKFIELLKSEVQKSFGDNAIIEIASLNYSRIINEKHYDRIEQLISDAKTKGAKIEWSGSTSRSERFMHPVILSHVSMDSKIMEEEIFGPVLPIISYSSLDEIIELINAKPKPLALYIFSASKKFQNKIMEETSAGSVCINDCVLQFTHPNLPFGGVNNSGIGKSHGKYGFIAFSNEKPVLKQRSGFSMPYLLHPPYTSRVKKLVDIMMRWL